MKELEYPFDPELLLKRSKRIKRELTEDGSERIRKKIAVLGGSTTHDILRMLELFLLDQGIEPDFYESEYDQYWQEAMFPGESLLAFKPDLIIVYTTMKNLTDPPRITDSAEEIDGKYGAVCERYTQMWDSLKRHFDCPVIQNNFDLPPMRLLGNRDAVDPHGLTNFINRLNLFISSEIGRRESLYLCDICYLSARIGLDKWSDPLYWHMYKYVPAVPVIPELAYQYALIIKAIYGKNKKALVLDLDNTLWGGIVGDDGVEGLEIGEETGLGQTFREFQGYLRAQKDLGVMLTVDSKNDEVNALAGLRHPSGILRPEDMVCIRANWEPKSRNFGSIAEELNILPESMVFVDDNPAEREIVRADFPGAAMPDIGQPETYLRVLDHAGYFENISLSEDDRRRSDMMRDNVMRNAARREYRDYGEYLQSLKMQAEIAPFSSLYVPRIAQLTNKSNQFNLTTKRYTEEEIRQAAEDPSRITLYGRLSDRFGDNGIVSLLIGRTEQADGRRSLHIELFLMSCRVLKRDMEYAMLDAVAGICNDRGISEIYGYYYPTAKNHMVEDLYQLFGFSQVSVDPDGAAVWKIELEGPWQKRNRYIEVLPERV